MCGSLRGWCELDNVVGVEGRPREGTSLFTDGSFGRDDGLDVGHVNTFV